MVMDVSDCWSFSSLWCWCWCGAVRKWYEKLRYVREKMAKKRRNQNFRPLNRRRALILVVLDTICCVVCYVREWCVVCIVGFRPPTVERFDIFVGLQLNYFLRGVHLQLVEDSNVPRKDNLLRALPGLRSFQQTRKGKDWQHRGSPVGTTSSRTSDQPFQLLVRIACLLSISPNSKFKNKFPTTTQHRQQSFLLVLQSKHTHTFNHLGDTTTSNIQHHHHYLIITIITMSSLNTYNLNMLNECLKKVHYTNQAKVRSDMLEAMNKLQTLQPRVGFISMCQYSFTSKKKWHENQD